MAHRHGGKNREHNRPPANRGRGQVALLVALIALGVMGSCRRPAATGEPPPDERAPFVGDWLRTDGDYMLRVAAAPTGVRVQYLNPRPIHVSQAELRPSASGLELMVELRDAGYPGSTYALHHNPATDGLDGVYVHAGLQQSFRVSFVRVSTP